MSHYFMHNIRLGCIVWIFDISQILGRTEYFKSKSIQKLPLTQDAMSRFDCETSLRFQVFR